MVLKWTNRGSNAVAASKPPPMPTATNVDVSPDVAYDGSDMKAASDVFKSYGKHIFTGNLAEYYLKKNGGSLEMMQDSTWVKDRSKANIIAAAVLDW